MGTREVLREFLRVKHGAVGLAILIFFLLFALAAPIISPEYPSRLRRDGPNYCAPAWLRVFDPDDPPTHQVLPNPSFEVDTSGWTYLGADAITVKHAPEGSKNPGSLLIEFMDDDPERAPGLVAGHVETAFEWKWKAPADVRIEMILKYDFEGDYSHRNLALGIEVASAGGRAWRPIHAPYPENWSAVRRGLTSIEIHHIFEKGQEVGFRFKVQILEHEPETTGSIKIWIDDCSVVAFSHYYGLLGTSESGVDVLHQLAWGTYPSLLVGITAALFAVSLGAIVGLTAGYYGAAIDELLMRVVDFIIILPGLVLYLLLLAIFGPTLENIILVLGLLGWAAISRVIRSQVLSEREKPYVEAARAAGASDFYIIFRTILPNVMPIVFVYLALGVGIAILTEAALSFLGFGPYGLVTWGKMLEWARVSGGVARGAWWYVVPPGLCIAALSMSFIFMGYALDIALNPRLRGRR